VDCTNTQNRPSGSSAGHLAGDGTQCQTSMGCSRGIKGRHLTCGFIPLVSRRIINSGCKQKEYITVSSEYSVGTDFGFVINHNHLLYLATKSSFSLLHVHES